MEADAILTPSMELPTPNSRKKGTMADLCPPVITIYDVDADSKEPLYNFQTGYQAIPVDKVNKKSITQSGYHTAAEAEELIPKYDRVKEFLRGVLTPEVNTMVLRHAFNAGLRGTRGEKIPTISRLIFALKRKKIAETILPAYRCVVEDCSMDTYWQVDMADAFRAKHNWTYWDQEKLDEESQLRMPGGSRPTCSIAKIAGGIMRNIRRRVNGALLKHHGVTFEKRRSPESINEDLMNTGSRRRPKNARYVRKGGDLVDIMTIAKPVEVVSIDQSSDDTMASGISASIPPPLTHTSDFTSACSTTPSLATGAPQPLQQMMTAWMMMMPMMMTALQGQASPASFPNFLQAPPIATTTSTKKAENNVASQRKTDRQINKLETTLASVVQQNEEMRHSQNKAAEWAQFQQAKDHVLGTKRNGKKKTAAANLKQPPKGAGRKPAGNGKKHSNKRAASPLSMGTGTSEDSDESIDLMVKTFKPGEPRKHLKLATREERKQKAAYMRVRRNAMFHIYVQDLTSFCLAFCVRLKWLAEEDHGTRIRTMMMMMYHGVLRISGGQEELLRLFRRMMGHRMVSWKQKRRQMTTHQSSHVTISKIGHLWIY